MDTTGNTGFFSSLALDSQDHPHIAYYDLTNTSLRYAYNNGATWQFTTIDSVGDVGWNPSIAINPLGYAEMSYYSATMGDLKLARSFIQLFTFLPAIVR